MIWPRFKGKAFPLAIAHRGDRNRYPENTLAAFHGALEAGADMIELDIQLTRDGEMVVIHDPELDRTTSGKGAVSEMTLEEVRGLSAGSWFSPRFSGERVPTLKEVFEGFCGKTLLDVEIKSEAALSRGPFPPIEKQAVHLWRQYGSLDSVLFSCFDSGILERLRALAPEAKIAVLHGTRVSPQKALERVSRVGAVAFNPNIRHTSRGLVDRLHAAGILVIPWSGKGTSNEASMGKALDLGADGFFADDPVLFMKLREERSKQFRHPGQEEGHA